MVSVEIGNGRAERAEAEFWATFARNVTLSDENRFTGAVPVAGGYALCLQGTYLDYGLAVGSSRALRPDDLRIVDEFYWARGLPSALELHPAVLARDGALLAGSGYRPALTLGLYECEIGAAAAAVRPGVTVESMSGRRSEWIELVVAAFGDAPPGDERHLHHAIQVCAAAGTELFAARLDGRLVGGAALGVVRDGALLYAAAVLPGYRRRGVHGALIAARLASARARGANYAFLKAGAGSGALSALRAGFTHVYDRTRLVKLS